VAYLLASTSRIRIGSGGVMLQHYSPFKVAEIFRVLENFAPGRVDLGVGKAPGGLPYSLPAISSAHRTKSWNR
jgi:alkanesulfonate monooxygenase SsuD/methylene tetrahydromethanopterin reductase-like flavin-dependent oxidoreductase (luciferase family)